MNPDAKTRCESPGLSLLHAVVALSASDKSKGNPDRLGDDGPRVPRGIPGKVSLVDVTPVVSGLVQHSYFLDCPKLVDDMKQVLIGVASDAISGRDYVHETNRYRLK